MAVVSKSGAKVGPSVVAGSPRRAGNEPRMVVQAPDGRREVHSTSNARDLSRHLGWRIIGKESELKAKTVDAPVEDAQTPVAPDTPPVSGADDSDKKDDTEDQGETPRLGRIETLRVKCEELGIEYDRRWGVNKLVEAIKAVKPDEEIVLETDGFPPLIPPATPK